MNNCYLLLTLTGVPHVGQAPESVRVTVVTPEHAFTTRHHGLLLLLLQHATDDGPQYYVVCPTSLPPLLPADDPLEASSPPSDACAGRLTFILLSLLLSPSTVY